MIHLPKIPSILSRPRRETVILILSAAAGLLVLLSLARPGGGRAPDATLWAALISCGIILLNTPGRQGFTFGLALSLWVMVSCLVSVALAEFGLISTAACTMSVCVATALAPAVMSMARVFRLMNDLDYLVSQISGWELLVENTRMAYTVIFLLFAVCAASGLALPEGRMVVLRWAGALTAVILYLILLLRGIVDSHEVVSGSRKESLRKLVRDNIIIQPVNPDRISLNHRMMYKRMCDYMEKKRPFLDEGFSLDDLSRALYTNRSYLSKMIGACTHMNFSRFVNNYRIRYSMELFKRDTRLKVMELAELSGFRSNVSYTQAFKMFLGVTPGEWCKTYTDSVSSGARPSRTQDREP